MAVSLVDLHHDRVAEIEQEIIEAEGVITQDQERELAELAASEEGLFAMAYAVLDLEAKAETLIERFVEPSKKRAKTWEHSAGRLRAMITPRLQELLKDKTRRGKPLRSLRSPDQFMSLVLVKGRGRLELNASELGSSKQVRGYTAKQAKESGIPTTYFERVVMYVPRTDVIRAHLEEKHEVGPAKVVVEETMQIRRPKKK